MTQEQSYRASLREASVIRLVHFTAALVATGAITLFWSGTAVTEVFGTHTAVVWVKQSIVWGMAILVPAITTAGATGFIMGGKWKTPLASAKKRRMPFIAINGILILMPSAFFLASRASAGIFDFWFYSVQVIELVAGAINLTLMGLNIRDGLRLSGRARKDGDGGGVARARARRAGSGGHKTLVEGVA